MTKKEETVTSGEKLISIEAVRVAPVRDHYGDLKTLAASIKFEGFTHPITLWSDGTLISGGRRLRVQLMNGALTIPAVFVSTIEDAAKRLTLDMEAESDVSRPMKWSEVCRLWELLRRLDEPAAVQRAEAARRRGVELRRATFAGKRKPGRFGYSVDYVLDVLAAPFGISEATAHRLRIIHRYANDDSGPAERQAAARRALKNIDSGASSIWANYSRLSSKRPAAAPVASRPAVQVESAPAARQVVAWTRSLPQMEGLVAGLQELGPPHPGVDRGQVQEVRARLMAVRRNLEKMINQMKENQPS